MRDATALEVAVGLLHLPSRARGLRDRVLPPDLDLLLRIVAGDERALSHAIETTGHSESMVRAAASFYIEQILLHPEADSYRALGAGPDATLDQLRRNMALLLRWLHPDHEANSERAVFVSRVTRAWNDVKTVERRAVYDATRPKTRVGGTSSERSPFRSMSPADHTAPAGGPPTGTRAQRRRPIRRPSVWRLLQHLIGQGRR